MTDDFAAQRAALAVVTAQLDPIDVEGAQAEAFQDAFEAGLTFEDLIVGLNGLLFMSLRMTGVATGETLGGVLQRLARIVALGLVDEDDGSLE